MDVKFVVPRMDVAFGVLEYAGEGKAKTAYVNGQKRVVEREYHLYSSVQRADNISVVLPVSAGEKHFVEDTQVVLIKPHLIAEGKSTGNSGYTNYILLAEDMIKA